MGLLHWRKWIAFPSGALFLGVISLILWDAVADWPALWPRFERGAAIGTALVAVIAVTALFRRARRLALGALALVIATASLVAAWMARSSGRNDLPLEDPTQTELVGAMAAIVLWGGVAVLVMGVLVVAGLVRGRRHRGFVEEFAEGAYYVAGCDCGWRGQIGYDSSEAFADAGGHANTVLLTPRKIAGLP